MADWQEKLNVFMDKASVVAADLGKKTEETIEIQKIKSQIRSLNRASEKDFIEIGKMVYDKFLEGIVESEDYIVFCENIEKRNEEIKELEADIEEIKGEV